MRKRRRDYEIDPDGCLFGLAVVAVVLFAGFVIVLLMLGELS